ncbi:MAG: ATP-binding protein, partial [Treponema sp.]|nr:ATP-binding protein [Treponema sp.]
ISAAMLRLSATDRNDPIDVPVPYSEIREIRDNANRMITKLNSVDESRQAFVSNVSHELKTPMSSMKVLADSLLSQEHQSEEVYREFLSDINTEIDRENQIISDLLTLVKLEGKATSLKTEKVHINGLAEIVIKRVLPLAEEQHVEVVVENQRDVYAEVDENSIIMALTNILENSVKYNKKNGSVRVTVNADWNNCFITIRDTGIGIPEESLSHLFEKFYRVDKARSRETGGSGLGLSIAYEIVKAHNGDIKVFSKLQKGTKFVITLPLVASKKGAAFSGMTSRAQSTTTWIQCILTTLRKKTRLLWAMIIAFNAYCI